MYVSYLNMIRFRLIEMTSTWKMLVEEFSIQRCKVLVKVFETSSVGYVPVCTVPDCRLR